MGNNKLFVLHFDWVVNRMPTNSLACLSGETRLEYIQRNLRNPDRLKVYLNTLHFAGYKIVLVNYRDLIFSEEAVLRSKDLMMRYLDAAFGRSRLFLQDPEDIHLYDGDEIKIYSCMSELAENFNASLGEEGNNNSSKHLSLLPLRLLTKNTLQTLEGVYDIVPTMGGIDIHLDLLRSRLNFRHQYYNFDYSSFDELNSLSAAAARLRSESQLHLEVIDGMVQKELRLKVEGEVYGLQQRLIEGLLKIPSDQRDESQLQADYRAGLSQIQTVFEHEIRTIIHDHRLDLDQDKEVAGRMEVVNEILTAYRTFEINGLSGRALQTMLDKIKAELEPVLDRLFIYYDQRQTHGMSVLDIERWKRDILQEQNQMQLEEKKSQYAAKANKLSSACISGDLVKFRAAKKEAEKAQPLLSFEKVFNEIDEAICYAPIHLACEFGYANIVDYLIRREADLEIKDRAQGTINGYQPIHHAVRFDHIEVVRMLLVAGVDINARGEYDRTPLYSAVQYGASYEMVQLLLERGANVSLRDEHFGQTPLHLAAQMGDAELVSLFLSHSGTNLQVTNELGETPLITACMHHQIATAYQFFECGITLNSGELEVMHAMISSLSARDAKVFLGVVRTLFLNRLEGIDRCFASLTTSADQSPRAPSQFVVHGRFFGAPRPEADASTRLVDLTVEEDEQRGKTEQAEGP